MKSGSYVDSCVDFSCNNIVALRIYIDLLSLHKPFQVDQDVKSLALFFGTTAYFDKTLEAEGVKDVGSNLLANEKSHRMS